MHSVAIYINTEHEKFVILFRVQLLASRSESLLRTGRWLSLD